MYDKQNIFVLLCLEIRSGIKYVTWLFIDDFLFLLDWGEKIIKLKREQIVSGVFGPDPHRDATRPSKLLRNKKHNKY